MEPHVEAYSSTLIKGKMIHFKKNPHYMLYYFYIHLLIALFSIVYIVFFGSFIPEVSLVTAGILFPFSFIFGLIIATAFHNASHGNIKPRWLNKVLGEVIGYYVLDGMRPFRVGHIAHHSHFDDPLLDPHLLMGQSFWQFIKYSKGNTIEVLKRIYFKAHGDNDVSVKQINHQLLIYKIGFVFKIGFWYFIFGPALFLLFYLPSFLSYFFGFAYLNYAFY